MFNCEGGASRARNAVSGICAVCGMRVPAAALRVAFGEGAEPLVTGQRAVPKVLERLGYAFRFVRVEDPHQELTIHRAPR